jgi:hypothetical protein
MANDDERLDDIRSRLHDAIYGLMLDQIAQDRYPSATMMTMVEQNMNERQFREYAEVLLDKIANDRFPSLDMVRRLTSLV